uniref:uncharacterized protein LOC117606110 n=1 Tax=Osmia lignaria TaxID=473952 RepID=UPI001478D9B4|nr:uncharacterized protein LOC117606110 [Osmia lignaria]
MRDSIFPKERLILTLRFLASGESYHSLMYLFRIPVCTISKIIPEVCKALYDTLHEEYLKVPSTQSEWMHIAKMYEEKWNGIFLTAILIGFSWKRGADFQSA